MFHAMTEIQCGRQKSQMAPQIFTLEYIDFIQLFNQILVYMLMGILQIEVLS